MLRSTIRWRELLDPRGRASRTEFLSVTALSWLALGVCGLLVHLMGGPLIPVATILVLGTMIAVTVVSGLNVIRRLHDWGRSGWWLLLILLVETPIGALAEPGWFPDTVVVAGNLLLALYLIALLICFGAVPGQRGSNRFGAPPGGPALAETFS
jgi:uncharacterized membrane protein YhaH (DUF805 family)